MNKNHGSLLALERWLDFNGWTGYDPYDIKGSCVFIHAQKHYGIPFFLNNFIEYFPKFSRLVFHIRPAYNAKAMALFARGYLNLYRASGKENYLDKARHCLMWLTENPRPGLFRLLLGISLRLAIHHFYTERHPIWSCYITGRPCLHGCI